VAHPPSWNRLVPGLLSLAAVVGAIVAILGFARVGTLSGKTVRLYVITDQAGGVIKGTEVWLYGEKIGIVRGTSLRPFGIDNAHRVLVDMDVLASDADRIRRDSRAQIRPGSSMIGAPVVFFSGGTRTSPPLRAGDTIASDPQTQLDVTRAKFADFERQIPEIRQDVDTLKAELFSSNGTLGAATRSGDAATARELRVLARQLNARRSRAAGTLALLGRGDLATRVQQLHAVVDSLRTIARSAPGGPRSMFGDTSFTAAVTAVGVELTAVHALLESPQGTVGRLRVDSAVSRQLDATSDSIRALARDAGADITRFLPF
jgi:hypothetical protein